MTQKTQTNPWQMDVRVRERNLKSGALTEKELEKNLAALPDLEGQAESFGTAQPALEQPKPEPKAAPPAPPPAAYHHAAPAVAGAVESEDDLDDDDDDDDADDDSDDDAAPGAEPDAGGNDGGSVPSGDEGASS